jgi:NAD(P)-dependent dehydrogenase (short-subunit alcohol dehydrogenase family)
MGLLDGKVIVVIGGTTGIGMSASKAFLAAGARVVSIGRNPAHVQQAQQELGSGAHVFSADATDPASAPRAIDQAVRRFKAFDALYHVAGGSGRKMGDGPLHEISDDGWEFTLSLNLTALFYSNRAAVQQLLKQGASGSILNMSSVLGFSPSPRYFSTHAYAAAKSAIIGLTRSSAAHYARWRIRFNVLAPALVETPMAERAVKDPAISNFIRSKQPLDGGRVGRPEDLDAAAVYFMSDESRFVTGQVLSIDGGWSVTEGQYQSPPP